MLRRIVQQTVMVVGGKRKTPGLRGVEDPGLGVQQRGAGGKSKLLCLVHLVQAELANFLQLFVGEENLLLISAALDVAEPGFAGDAKDLRFGETEKDGCPARRHIFWKLAIHYLPSQDGSVVAMESCSTAMTMAL